MLNRSTYVSCVCQCVYSLVTIFNYPRPQLLAHVLASAVVAEGGGSWEGDNQVVDVVHKNNPKREKKVGRESVWCLRHKLIS